MNAMRSPAISRIPASSASARPPSASCPAASSTRWIVGSTSAATTRVTCAPSSPEGVEALEHEVLESGRDRQLLAGLDAAAPLDCTRELEGEKGVPTRGLTDAQEDRARERGSRADPEQLVESAQAEWAELDRREPLRGDRSGEPGRHHVTGGEERGNGLVFEPRQGVAEHCQRRRVEPLDIVDREQQSLTLGEGSQDREEANATSPSSARSPSTSERPRAASSARRCGRGTSGNTSSATPPSRSARPTNEKPASTSEGRHDNTRYPSSAAASVTAFDNDVFPIPASPQMTATPNDAAGASRRSRRAASSSSRPRGCRTLTAMVPCEGLYDRCARAPPAGPAGSAVEWGEQADLVAVGVDHVGVALAPECVPRLGLRRETRRRRPLRGSRRLRQPCRNGTRDRAAGRSAAASPGRSASSARRSPTSAARRTGASPRSGRRRQSACRPGRRAGRRSGTMLPCRRS